MVHIRLRLHCIVSLVSIFNKLTMNAMPFFVDNMKILYHIFHARLLILAFKSCTICCEIAIQWENYYSL